MARWEAAEAIAENSVIGLCAQLPVSQAEFGVGCSGRQLAAVKDILQELQVHIYTNWKGTHRAEVVQP